MFTVYADGNLIWDPRLQGDLAKQYAIFSDSLQQEVNKAGAFTFTIYPTHPAYDKIFKLRTTVVINYGDDIFFRGRVLNDFPGSYNERKIQCEGELAFLGDVCQPPFVFPQDEEHTTPADYLAFLLDYYNSQQPADRKILLGNVTVTDSNGYIARSDTEYSTTLQLIQEGLLNTHGGYLSFRHVGSVTYLDYLEDFSVLANQPVRLGFNLLSISSDRRGEEAATAILPLGAKDDNGVRLNIFDAKNETTDDICIGDLIVYSKSAESRFGGRIVKKMVWDDVTELSNLLTRAKSELGTATAIPSTVTITAADASAAALDGGVSYNTFRVGTYIAVEDAVHADTHGLLPTTYLLRKRTGSLQNPASNRLTFGATTYGYTEENRRQQETAWKIVEANVTQSQTQAIRELERRINSAILQSSEAIRTEVSDDYYLKGETDDLVSSVATQLTQTAKNFNFRFSSMEKDIGDVADGADAKFDEIIKYIRFEDGNIILGEVGNQLTLKIQKNRISFIQSGAEVAYFSNKKLYVNDGHFLNSLRIGSFEFFPRSNENLSLRKVGG